MTKLLEFKGVNFAYQTKTDEILALSNINFSINKEDFVSFVGPSGCGKTTILSLISGLLSPSDGKILYENEDISSVSQIIYPIICSGDVVGTVIAICGDDEKKELIKEYKIVKIAATFLGNHMEA